jgi:hypothetical protein
MNKYGRNFPLEFCERVNEMEQNGIILSRKQSEILEREYGAKIPPHFITEYKYYERKKMAL